MPGGNASETNRHRRISRPGSLRSTRRIICRPSDRRRRRAADTRRATPRRGSSSRCGARFLDALDDAVASHSSRAELNGPSVEAGRSNRSFSCASARLRMCGSMSRHATVVVFRSTNRSGTHRSAARASAYNRSQRAFASIITSRVRPAGHTRRRLPSISASPAAGSQPSHGESSSCFPQPSSTTAKIRCRSYGAVFRIPRQYAQRALRSLRPPRDGPLLPPLR